MANSFSVLQIHKRKLNLLMCQKINVCPINLVHLSLLWDMSTRRLESLPPPPVLHLTSARIIATDRLLTCCLPPSLSKETVPQTSSYNILFISRGKIFIDWWYWGENDRCVFTTWNWFFIKWNPSRLWHRIYPFLRKLWCLYWLGSWNFRQLGKLPAHCCPQGVHGSNKPT